VGRSISRSTWEKKLAVYRRWGLSEEEILASFVKFPWFMALSEEKIMALIDLFVHKLGWEAFYLAKNLSIASNGMEKRFG
jgi:mTERF domain-containing protein